MRPSVGSALSMKMPSAVSGRALKFGLSTPPSRSTTHSRLEARTNSSASNLVLLYSSNGRGGVSARTTSVTRWGLREP